ncbi:TraR/DksA C4-type zinc finger protein [Homoserinimonas sp. OAct 916]|uniref:TraR/DksA family transcriptional regulator n=1 Tax=Homoserinimonas sp. OAct 916 TaxID=2211450 RepID=UPI000DBE2944|nr:TraR/DksA C4-type zinc finger protein [Homoserinimonas sp. OAct 916]
MTHDFSAAQRARFRALLEEQREADRSNAFAATRNMQLISDARQDSSTDDEHDPEGVTLAFERSSEAAMVQRSERGVAEASAALARLDDGSYGLCEECGNEIATARLEARPATTLCIECARRHGA